MKKHTWVKWLIFAFVVVIFFIFVIPIIINESYKSNSGYMTMWGAGDVLSYYGTALGSAVTIAVLFVTISFTRKQIQRESYLKDEKEKWSNLDNIISKTLIELNPMPSFQLAISIGFDDPYAAISTFQEYMHKCKTSTDILLAYLSTEDYPKVQQLIDKITENSKLYCNIAESATAAYSKWQAYINKDLAKKTLDIETQMPGTFPADDVAFCKEVINITQGVSKEEFTGLISSTTDKMVIAYETTYRPLLQFKGQTFDTIYKAVQEEADEILHLWRKKECQHLNGSEKKK